MEINRTEVKDFILLAFTDLNPEFQNLLFYVFLLTYVTCVMGNIAIIFLVSLEPALNTRMYFFISVFSALEIMFVSTTIPKFLANLVLANNIIYFGECFAQMYIFISLGATECYFLVVMVFDRYMAINKPLHYLTVMTQDFCRQLAVVPWVIGFVITLAPTIITANLEFCGPNRIDHFYCDMTPLQNLACSDPLISILFTSVCATFSVVSPLTLITIFYIHIIMTISKIKTERGKQKAFSTCSSHLIVASLFYGATLIVYAKPKGSHYDKYFSFMYTVFTPTINPFIYTFRNTEVKKIFRNSINHCVKSVSL